LKRTNNKENTGLEAKIKQYIEVGDPSSNLSTTKGKKKIQLSLITTRDCVPRHSSNT
jgi:hypothetical protein